MTPEGRITAQILRYLRDLRKRGRKVWWVKIHGAPSQRAGIPDLLLLDGGRWLFVEIKAPKKEPTPLQAHTMNLIRRCGGETHVVRSLDEFKEILK